HGFREVVVGSRVHAGSEQVDVLVGPARPDLAPPLHLALRLGGPERLQLRHRHAVRPGVLGIYQDGQAVVRDRQLDVLDALRLAGLHLGRLDGTGRVRDVGLTGAELLEAAAGAGDADRDPRAGI